jgi:hypothetical protein
LLLAQSHCQSMQEPDAYYSRDDHGFGRDGAPVEGGPESM